MQKNVLITTLLLTITLTCSACGSSAFFGMRPANGEAGEREVKTTARAIIGNVFEDKGKLSEIECKYFNNGKLAESEEEYEAYWTLGFRNEESGDYEILVDAVNNEVMQISRCPSDKECAELLKKSVEAAVRIDENDVAMTAGVGSILAKPTTYGQTRENKKKLLSPEEVQVQWKPFTDAGIKAFENLGFEVTDAYCTMVRNEEVFLRDAEGIRHKLNIPCIYVVVTYGDGQVGDVCITEADLQPLIIHMDRGRIKL